MTTPTHFYTKKINPANWRALKRIIRFALQNRYASFYRKKYRKFGLDKLSAFSTHEDFFKIPFLQKEEFLNIPPWQNTFIPRKKIGSIGCTSGSTGQKPLIIFKDKNHYKKNYEGLEILESWGKKLNCAMLLVNHRVTTRNITSVQKFVPVIAGNPYQMRESAALAKILGVDAIVTSPTLAIHFANFLKQEYDPKKIKLLILAHEQLTSVQKNLIKQEYANCTIAQAYGSTEFSCIGKQCDTLAKQELPVFHVATDQIFFEIIPDANNDNSGEIVISQLKPHPTLFIRYRTGDRGKWINKKCKCGLNLPLFKALGRIQLDKIKISGFEIHRKNFETIINNFLQLVEDDFEAHFYQQAGVNKIINSIIVKIIPKNNMAIDKNVISDIERMFNAEFKISNKLPFKDLVSQGIFAPIKVEMLDIPRTTMKTQIKKRLIPHL